MAGKKKQSADEIVDNLAEEMGVKDAKPDESADNLAADLGGLFGVSSKKKKKKKVEEEPPAEEAKEEEAPADEEEASDDAAAKDAEDTSDEEEEDAFDAISSAIEDSLDDDDDEKEEEKPAKKAAAKKSEPKKSASKPSKEGIDGIFAPAGGGGGGGDADPVDFDDSYLDEDDLGGASAGGANKMLIGAVAVLALALIGVVLGTTSVGKDIVLVFKGEYRAQKDADKQAAEEKFNAEQEAALPKFGNISIVGSPKYATILLNGEIKYAETSAGWREVQLNPGYSNFGNLPIKEKQVITVSSPGFETKTFEITEGKWQGGQGGLYNYALTATLLPTSPWSQSEFEARMSSDAENDYFGKMVLNSVPAGATISLNNKPLLDEKGEQLKTPVTFDKIYIKDDKGKLEEQQVRVDTVFDEGHKLVMSFPEKPDMPAYANQIERQLWTCTKKSDEEIAKLPKDHLLQAECDYTYTKTVDFNELQGFIKRQDELRKEIEERNKKVRELRASQKEGKELDPTLVDAVKK